jgi:hypothetical protein
VRGARYGTCVRRDRRVASYDTRRLRMFVPLSLLVLPIVAAALAVTVIGLMSDR